MCCFILQLCAVQFQSHPLQKDASATWASVHLLLSGAVVVFHPLAMDAVGSACHFCTKIQKNVVRDIYANVKWELMMAPIFSPVLVNSEKAWEALESRDSLSPLPPQNG